MTSANVHTGKGNGEQAAVDEVVERSTLSRIAAAADVSTSTVSKVLNGRAGVSDATRARVESLLDRHGYQRRSARGTAPLLELVFARLTAIWPLQVLHGVQKVAQQRGVGVVVTESGDRTGPGPEWMDAVLQRNPVGAILVLSGVRRSQQRQLIARGIPFVVVDPAGDPAAGVASVGSANWNGGLVATRHLLAQGHRRIGLIAGPANMMSSRARIAGFRSALEEAGLPVDESLIISGDFERDSGLLCGQELLNRPDRPTAIFALNDLMALGVYEAARLAGLAIPEDLSVIGYDDLSVAQWTGPPLTTIRQPLIDMGRQAAQMVLDPHPAGQAQRVDLAIDLVERSSTGPAPV
jgi:LacI family xylobiose transport system transcriptional regulator